MSTVCVHGKWNNRFRLLTSNGSDRKTLIWQCSAMGKDIFWTFKFSNELVADKIPVIDEMLSPLQWSIEKSYGNVQKLITKTKWVIHHQILQQYVELGIKVTKVHRVIVFKEEAWLKPFIGLNTEMKKEAIQDGDTLLLRCSNWWATLFLEKPASRR